MLHSKIPVILTNRISLFFFLIGLFTAFLYALGTVQGFMDDTQFILLRLAGILGILLTTSSFVGIILDFVFYLSKKKFHYLGTLLLHTFYGIFGLILAYAASFILVISGGI